MIYIPARAIFVRPTELGWGSNLRRSVVYGVPAGCSCVPYNRKPEKLQYLRPPEKSLQICHETGSSAMKLVSVHTHIYTGNANCTPGMQMVVCALLIMAVWWKLSVVVGEARSA